MIFTNTRIRSKPHLVRHHGHWFLMRAHSLTADAVYHSLKWWYYADTGKRL